MPAQLNAEIRDSINSILREKSIGVFASLIYGPYAGGYADERTAIDVLAIIETEPNKTLLESFSERISDRNVRFLMIDRRTFEEDARSEKIGGIVAENLLTPYDPIMGGDYLEDQEVRFKRRIIKDILANLVLSFPEMSKDLLIRPEYFLFESMMRRAVLFPLISYRFLNVTAGEWREKNLALILRGFNAAISDLINEGVLRPSSNNLLGISEKYIMAVRGKRLRRIKNIFGAVRRGVIRCLLGAFSEIRESLLDEYRIYRERHPRGKIFNNPTRSLEDPGKYIFMPTALGITPFSERVTIDGFVRKYMPSASIYSIKRLGGVLNSVYVLRFFGKDSVEERVVVKMFKDWYGWKWFPLALWAFGTKGFSVLGKTRLEKEYAINRLLSNQGINVPKIICMNPREKILFQEYINGVTVSKIIRQIYGGGDRKNPLMAIRGVGREIAKIHSLGVSIGDCKPENIVLAADGRIFFVDLEQAEVGGDQAWDIAEFLYYLGHYALLPPPRAVKEIVNAFAHGYIEAGGKVENIKRILSPKYIKVFSFFTPPHILLTIANSCKEILDI